MYREIAKKLLSKYPGRIITKKEAKHVLCFCFKIGKYKRKVFQELEDYGMLIFINKQEYYINYVEFEGEEEPNGEMEVENE